MLLPSSKTFGVFDLYTAELNESHRLLDTVGIPQSGYEEQLSISQRVATAVAIIKSLREPHVTR